MNPVLADKIKVVWQELKRRKVFQVALVYVFMAWVLMQVGDLLFEALQLPESAYTLLVILVLMGFPVAVVLAWAYEITPDGVKRDIVQELRREMARLPQPSRARDADSARCHRVAILPFRDMAPEHCLDYFCEGIAEEAQNALSGMPGVEVVARAHSVQYGGDKIDIDLIRERLLVDAIIEGSVRRSDGLFRVSVQLVDIWNGTNIWSRSFEHPVGREFDIQKIVAAEVAGLVQRTLVESGGEEWPEAFQQVLPIIEPGDGLDVAGDSPRH